MTQHLRALPCPFIGLLDIEVWQPGPGTRLPGALHAAGQRAEGTRAKAIVIELSPESLAMHLPGLRREVSRLLGTLGSNARRIVAQDQWWFTAGDGAQATTWFTTVHAGLYPAGHSRHWPLPRPVVTLVPAWLFAQVLPRGASPDTRQGVRQAFTDAGMHYPLRGGAVAGLD